MKSQEQVLREVDKLDRVGPLGVFERLTNGLTDDSGAHIPGSGLSPANALFIVAACSNEESGIPARIKLMSQLDQINSTEGRTLWDELIDMPTNEDNTWSKGRRPKNIGWALDDIIKFAKES